MPVREDDRLRLTIYRVNNYECRCIHRESERDCQKYLREVWGARLASAGRRK